MKSAKRAFGDIGENVAVAYLEKNGFKVIERNYLRKWGEIDIVARKGSSYHFIEVKSARLDSSRQVSHVTTIRAEENMHPGKLKRLQRTVQTYLLEKRIDADWQIDLVVVKIDESTRQARVEAIPNII